MHCCNKNAPGDLGFPPDDMENGDSWMCPECGTVWLVSDKVLGYKHWTYPKKELEATTK